MKINIYKYIIILYTLLMSLSVKAVAANKTVNMKLTYNNQTHDYSAEEVFVAVDGEKLENLSMPPIILNGYTLVPAREVFEKTEAKVEWNDDIEQVLVTSNDNIIVIPINSKNAYVNGKITEMDTEAKIINNKTMIPLRFVSAAMGYEVSWDNETRIANINLPMPKVLEEITETKGKDYTYYDYNYKLVNSNDEILAEYPYICYIGCNMYLFRKDNDDGNDYYGVLDKSGKVIIEPKYNYVEGTKYAVNNIVTFQSGNRFDIYDNKGNLKKSIESPLGYELSYPGYNEKYLKRYDVEAISGSNVVVAEHLGDMLIESTPKQEYFIIRLFSEKKAAEEYYSISPFPNGEFSALKRTDSRNVVLNPDGSPKFEADAIFINYLDDGLYYGYDYKYSDMTYEELKEQNKVNIFSNDGKVLIEDIFLNSIKIDKNNKKLSVIKDNNYIELSY